MGRDLMALSFRLLFFSLFSGLHSAFLKSVGRVSIYWWLGLECRRDVSSWQGWGRYAS